MRGVVDQRDVDAKERLQRPQISRVVTAPRPFIGETAACLHGDECTLSFQVLFEKRVPFGSWNPRRAGLDPFANGINLHLRKPIVLLRRHA